MSIVSTAPGDPALLALATEEPAPCRRFDWAVRASDKIRISGVTLAEALTLNTQFGHWCKLEAHVAT